jgi:hypothetical protein
VEVPCLINIKRVRQKVVEGLQNVWGHVAD